MYSCTDNEVMKFTNSSSANLSFSTDTVLFDTVFTTIGSTTKQFKIYNRNNNAVKTSIHLAGGSNSYYRLNIDGQPASELNDYELLGNDSAYVFVEVNVDPQKSNSPIVIDDSIMFYTNGNEQKIKLVAYGQDVHLYNDSVITTRTWFADKPYLIYNSALVDSGEVLTINPGAEIYFHNESALWVLGTIKANGTVDQPITFQGDRLEEWYKDAPGQWYGVYRNDSTEYLTGGIHFWQGSHSNVLNYTIIKNGVKGIQVDLAPDPNSPTLILSNSIIQNMSSIGLMAQSTNLLVYNSVIANCGHFGVALSLGGNYEFYHTTIANYYPPFYGSRSSEALAFNNYYMTKNDTVVFDFSALFGNCIIDGSMDNEFIVDQFVSGTHNFSFLFDHCYMKLDEEFDTSNDDVFKDIIRTADSVNYVDINTFNFRLDSLSVAIDKGTDTYSEYINFDLDGNNRTLDEAPDLGAYEWNNNQE